MGESNNRAVTRALANSLWPTLMPYLATAETLPTERLDEHPGREQFAATLAEHLRGLTIAKVKVYDMSGRTVFSTDPKQIGERQSGNPGFRSARFGGTISELTHRDQFSSFERVIENADLLSTYLPVRRSYRRGGRRRLRSLRQRHAISRAHRAHAVVGGPRRVLDPLRALRRAVRDRAARRRRDPAAVPAARRGRARACAAPSARSSSASRSARSSSPASTRDCRPRSPSGVSPTSASSTWPITTR